VTHIAPPSLHVAVYNYVPTLQDLHSFHPGASFIHIVSNIMDLLNEENGVCLRVCDTIGIIHNPTLTVFQNIYVYIYVSEVSLSTHYRADISVVA
jgi:hypothetical protein